MKAVIAALLLTLTATAHAGAFEDQVALKAKNQFNFTYSQFTTGHASIPQMCSAYRVMVLAAQRTERSDVYRYWYEYDFGKDKMRVWCDAYT